VSNAGIEASPNHFPSQLVHRSAREVGETVFLHPAYGTKAASFEPGRAIVLEGWGAFVVEALD
jgi:hypothetical protein